MPILNVGKGIECIYRKGQGSGCLANFDLLNTVYISDSRALDSSAPQIPPLGCIIVDGSRDIYASTLSTTILQVQSMPGVTNWIASPAQIAAQVAATGAPPLAFSRLIYFTGFSIPVAVGTPVVSAQSAVSGTGYEFGGVLGAAANAFLKIDFAWSDPSGQNTAQQTWWLIPGTTPFNYHGITGSGPTSGGQVQVTFTAFVNTVTITFSLIQNSRQYSRHDFRTQSWSTSPVTGTIQPTETPTLQLFQLPSVSFGIGVTNTYLLPLYAGRVRFFGQTSSGTTDMKVAANNLADQTSTGNNPFWKGVSDATGTINAEFSLPRAQSDFTITNGNAAAKNLEGALIIEEY